MMIVVVVIVLMTMVLMVMFIHRKDVGVTRLSIPSLESRPRIWATDRSTRYDSTWDFPWPITRYYMTRR